MIELFKETVHRVCAHDYSPEQLRAWAPDFIDENLWEKRFLESYTILTVDSDKLLGFANLESNGNIDMFYVSAHAQGMGVGKTLMRDLENHARSFKWPKLTSDVSLTARKFFQHSGFQTEKEYIKTRDGVHFPNALMFKKLSYQ